MSCPKRLPLSGIFQHGTAATWSSYVTSARSTTRRWTRCAKGALGLCALIPEELEPVVAGRGRKIHVDADMRYTGQYATTKDQRQSHSRPRRDVGLLQQRLERLSRSIRRQLNWF